MSMKKTMTTISLTLLIALTSLVLRLQVVDPSTSMIDDPVTLYLVKDSGKFSTHPLHSDLLHNAVFMSNVVGTMVRFDQDRRFVPYLAKSWTHSENYKSWTFYLRENLEDESGLEITAENFKKGLVEIFKLFPKRASLPIFDELKKWREFKNGELSEPAIVADNKYQLTFHFQNKKVDGVLDFLSMPYFGFYNPRQFGMAWNDQHIISSGGFSVDSISESEVSLKGRENWISETPSSLKIKLVSDESTVNYSNSIVYKMFERPEDTDDAHEFKVGAPMVLNALVLSNLENSQFKNTDVRRKFVEEFRKSQKKFDLSSMTHTVSSFFHPVLQTDLTPLNSNSSLNFDQPVSVSITNALSKNERQYFEQIFGDMSTRLGIQFKPEIDDRRDPEKTIKITSNTLFDMRIVRVVVGLGIENWNNRMMFCSNLGVSFLDPSGRVCALTKEYEDKNGYLPENNYKDRFNQAIYEDASVVPVFSSSFTWSYDPRLVEKYFSPIQLYPDFEDTSKLDNYSSDETN